MTSAIHMTGLAVALLAALGAGMVMSRLRQPPLLGYVAIGIVLGPGGFAIAADQGATLSFAELFLVLLLFATGVEFGARASWTGWKTGGAVAAGLVAAGLIAVLPLALLLGQDGATSVLVGLAVAFSGVAPAFALAMRSGGMAGRCGRLATTVIMAQAVVFLPAALIVIDMGADGFGFLTVLKGALAGGAVAGGLYMLARRPRLTLPLDRFLEGGTASALFGAMVYCFTGAAVLGVIGLPPALGALLAGVVAGNSTSRRRILAAIRPVRGIVSLAFFLFLGLLTDLGFLWSHIGTVIVLLVFAIAFRTAVPAVILRSTGESWQRAGLAAILVAPMGELAVALGIAALGAGTVTVDGAKLAFTLVALMLLVSPFWLAVALRLRAAETVPAPTLAELWEVTFGAAAATLRETAHPAPGPPPAEAPAAGTMEILPPEDYPDEQFDDEEEDAFSELAEQVRDAARNDADPSPPESEADGPEPGPEEDGRKEDGPRPPPRPDA